MKITITGSLGNIGRPLTILLTKAGHEVSVISSNAGRKAEIESLGATAWVGSVSDSDFLTTAFAGADAVFAMTPPNFGGSNIINNTILAGKAIASAVQAAGVKRVVMLSSIGADIPAGTGPIAALHQIEKIYNELENVSVSFLRAGYFYTNFLGMTGMVEHAGILGGNYPASVSLPLVYPADIASVAAEALQQKITGNNILYVVSEVLTPEKATAILGNAIGKPNLPWVSFTDEQSVQGMVQAGMTEEMAGLYTEMGAGFSKGLIQADYEKQGSPVIGSTPLDHFAKEVFAKAF